MNISVVIITHNNAQYLNEAIESVLAQTFADWELIIIDDGSTDNTQQLIQSYLNQDQRIKYFKNEYNLGIVQSRNKALSLCNGEYVAVLDSDDIWLDNDKLSKQVKFLTKNFDCVLCGGTAKLINQNDKEIGQLTYQTTDEKIRKKILLSNQFVHSTVMFRKEVADSVGGYGQYEVGEDYDLFLKLGLNGKLFNFSENFVKYRFQNTGATWKNKYLSASCHLIIIKKYKHKYPNYWLALIKAYLRIILSKIVI